MIKRRNRTKQNSTLEERLTEDAKTACEKARAMPPGPERELLLRRARRNDVAAHMSEWLRSPGLQIPK